MHKDKKMYMYKLYYLIILYYLPRTFALLYHFNIGMSIELNPLH